MIHLLRRYDQRAHTGKVLTVRHQARTVDNVGFIKGLDKHNMPRLGDVMVSAPQITKGIVGHVEKVVSWFDRKSPVAAEPQVRSRRLPAGAVLAHATDHGNRESTHKDSFGVVPNFFSAPNTGVRTTRIMPIPDQALSRMLAHKLGIMVCLEHSARKKTTQAAENFSLSTI